MSWFNRLLAVGIGAAVGCAATLLVQRCAQMEHTEGLAGESHQAPKTDSAPATEPEQATYIPVTGPEDATPNRNPMDAPVPVAPRRADGRVDVERLADPADFADWDDLGCQG